ncbi:MAG: decaprenyl-phosphate phosphoribosyltransferase [Deltaproteobacteria bacterium]|nr:decaprenyl-phosphate phosphoribosyltransferase [Deltaproteobacteria bacterium]
MRPKQWTKNLVLFAALLFSRNLFSVRLALLSMAAFVIFALLSGGVYIFNDLMDMEEDKLHPKKSMRPLSAGLLSPKTARAAFFLAAAAAIGASFFINTKFAIAALAYLSIQIAYCLFFKNAVILDVFSIASGFFLRVVAGGAAISVPISPWLMVCTFFLSLFLSLCKRRHEILLLPAKDAAGHRNVLREYNIALLDQMITVVTSGTVLTYAIYTIAEETVRKFHTPNLLYTIPFVLYGVYRYLYLVYHKKEGGSPEIVLLSDRPMIINIILYAGAVVAILY